MLLTDFQAKLRRIDTRLFVNTERPDKRENGHKFGGLYFKKPRVEKVNVKKSDRNAVHENHAKFLDALETGQMDIYVTAICLDFIPEYDIFNMNYTRLSIMGWRSIALLLVEKKIATLEKVRKVFQCEGLGESDYDRAGFFGKIEIAKRLADG